MPVYNAANFLPEALASIQKQTWKDFEVICVDDCSTDNSYKILERFAKTHKKFRVYKLLRNHGTAYAANIAIEKAKGQYICRMDGDDIMLPKRLEQQVSFLRKNPSVIAVGGQCIRMDESGRKTGMKAFPLSHDELASMVFRASPIQQPTLMVNRAKLPKHFVWYRPALKIGEDYDLYYRLMMYGRLANLKHVILKYREHPTNLTLTSQKRTFWYICKSRLIALTDYGYKPDIFSIFNVMVQIVLVVILPEKLLYSLHLKTRHLFFKFAK